jgi:hypothetical protein
MKKGSTKMDTMTDALIAPRTKKIPKEIMDRLANGEGIDEVGGSITEYDKTHALALPSIQEEVLDILLRICDACHDIDNRTEPWVSIRRDIQRLK